MARPGIDHGRRYRNLFMTPDGRVGARVELGLRYKSETLWTGKRLAHRRHKVIEKLAGKTDFRWVWKHPTYVPDRPKRMKRRTYRRLRKMLTTAFPGKTAHADRARAAAVDPTGLPTASCKLGSVSGA